MALHELTALGDLEELRGRAQKELSDVNVPTLTRLAALRALFWALRSQGGEVALRDLAGQFEAALAADADAHRRHGFESSIVGSLVVLGFVYERLDEAENAKAAYSRALAISPTNEAALVARGLSAVASEPAAANADFEAAIRSETRLWWPYAHVALTKLQQGQYRASLVVSLQGLSKVNDDSQLATFYELAGLASYYLGDVAAASQLLSTASALSPFNERIAGNREAVEASRAAATVGEPAKLEASLDVTADEFRASFVNKMSESRIAA